MKLKKLYKEFFGTIQILLSLFWFFHIVQLYFDYPNPNLLFAFRFPNWILVIELILSLINFILGINLVLKKIRFKNELWFFYIFYYNRCCNQFENGIILDK